MAWREIIYQYDGSFEGLLCCVFESYTKKERPTAILRDGDDEPSLFEICAVTTDRAHAQRIYRSLYKRSPEVGSFLRRAFLTCLPDKEMAIYRFIVKFYREGAPLLSRLSDDTYLPLLKAVRQLRARSSNSAASPAFPTLTAYSARKSNRKTVCSLSCAATSASAITTRRFSSTTARTARRCSIAAACRASCRSITLKWRSRTKSRRAIAASGAAFTTPSPSRRAK